MSNLNESNAQGRPAPTSSDATTSSAPNDTTNTNGSSASYVEELINRSSIADDPATLPLLNNTGHATGISNSSPAGLVNRAPATPQVRKVYF